MWSFPHSRKWFHLLSERFGEAQARSILSRSQVQYDQLLTVQLPDHILNPKNPKELKNLIFPGLAVYKSIIEVDPGQTRALSIMDELFREDLFRTMGIGIGLLNYLTNPFPLIRPVLKYMIRAQYPPGYQVIIKDTPDTLIAQAVRCVKLEVLTALNARELTSLYCKTDDWLSEKLPKVHWERTKTLAAGDEICDFCWTRQGG